MPQAQDAAAYIFQGVWTNWTKGKYLGATLTLAPKNMTVVVSIVSIFIQVAGTQLWRIIQLSLHQVRAKPDPQDGMYHEQQVILRNSGSELGTLWQLMRVAFAWRHQEKVKSYWRSIVLVTWCFCHFVTFNLLGIFSSRLLDAGDEVLSRSPFCGAFNSTYHKSMGAHSDFGIPNHMLVEFEAHAQSRYQQTQQYVQFCSDPSAPCKILPQDKLAWNWTVTDTCPFDSRVCTDHGTVVFDTGLISSHRHLGLNADKADRIQYRRVSSCTPLNDKDYITDWKDLPATARSPAKRVVDAYYGPSVLGDRNATYSFSDWTQYYSFDQYSGTNPYQLNLQYAAANDTTGRLSSFLPIPELARTDADLFLIFLSSDKVYESPINDPWYLAQQAGPFPLHDKVFEVNGTVYSRARPVTTLACIEQHQICINNDSPSSTPDANKCTPLSGYAQTVTALNNKSLWTLTYRQIVTISRVFSAAVESSMYDMVRKLAQRDTPLLARQKIQGLVGLHLPDDQWQKETVYWHSLAMANLQLRVVDYATGQFAVDTAYINMTTTPELSWLCQNQIVRSTTYQSFDFFALVFVLVVGSLVIIIGLSLEDSLALLRRRKLNRGGHRNARQDMWVKNEMLEMLRMLFEWHSPSVWSHSSNGIPIAGPGQKMVLDELSPCCVRPSPPPTTPTIPPFQFQLQTDDEFHHQEKSFTESSEFPRSSSEI